MRRDYRIVEFVLILSIVVDKALEVVDAYQDKLLKLEHQVLVKPDVNTVRYLHIVSGDLTLHRQTLDPIKTLIFGLRRYDVDRCAALINSSGEDKKVVGFMSHKSKVYLADVYDHIDHVINAVDMYSNVAENLINYTFNMASYEMNDTMRRLTTVTIIFLPLTLLTGYFGMNFVNMWSVMHNHSDVIYWIIALPMMVLVGVLFLYEDFGRLCHLISKRWKSYTVARSVKHRAL